MTEYRTEGAVTWNDNPDVTTERPMTPTEALATALRTAYWSQWDEGTAPAAAEAILAHLPPGIALVSVEEVADALAVNADPPAKRGVEWYYEDARRLLGLGPER